MRPAGARPGFKAPRHDKIVEGLRVDWHDRKIEVGKDDLAEAAVGLLAES
jgi:hypothetical protein